MNNTQSFFYQVTQLSVIQNQIQIMRQKARKARIRHFLSLLRQSSLARLLTVGVCASASASAAVTLRKRTVRRLHAPNHDVDVRCRLQSLTVPTHTGESAFSIHTTCSVLVYDMSRLKFDTDITLHCDNYLSVLILILPQDVEIVSSLHEFTSRHTCDDRRSLTGEHPKLYLKANSYGSVLHIKRTAAVRPQTEP